MVGFFFGPPRGASPYNSQSPIRSTPERRAALPTPQEGTKETSPEAEEEVTQKKTYAKEKAVKSTATKGPETETQVNTRLNALLYHTSDDSVDLYRQENTLLDLLGRLYYDDYDLDLILSPEGSIVLLPSISPAPTPPRLDYFMSKLATVATALLPALRTPVKLPNPRPALPRITLFERGILFDTLDDKKQLLTLKLKHPHFKFRRNNKTFLTGFNNDRELLHAIEWLFDELIVHGDTIVVLQVLDEKLHDHVDRPRAERALHKIELLNKHVKKVLVVFEVVVGRPQKLLQRAIDEYLPAMMVIGTHDQPKSHHLFLSKTLMLRHFLQCALVPVIVVKPTYHHVYDLERPVEKEDYFHRWLANVDISGSFEKPKRSRLLSPSSLRQGSHTNLASMEDRGRKESTVGDLLSESDLRGLSHASAPMLRLLLRSTSRTGLSKFFHHG